MELIYAQNLVDLPPSSPWNKQKSWSQDELSWEKKVEAMQGESMFQEMFLDISNLRFKIIIFCFGKCSNTQWWSYFDT